ncbi:hypothetical protein D9758_014019 [Tetrapyrgos nigripes]|uniref:Uncharacterized protein n=1 Tax=Tetrapyrgos nigripes TaxID=182062 RepID=A0A8H5FUQ6_9AGAR|nr:hypothetical protein D9758_014019 [Tetrapyrgos nigripes]
MGDDLVWLAELKWWCHSSGGSGLLPDPLLDDTNPNPATTYASSSATSSITTTTTSTTTSEYNSGSDRERDAGGDTNRDGIV